MRTALLTTAPIVLAQAANTPVPASNNELAVWAIILLGMAVVLFFTELFVPSGGLIGAASAACLVGGIVMLSVWNSLAGLIAATVAVAALPFVMALAIKIIPNTPIARWLTLHHAQKARVTGSATAGSGGSGQMVGVVGKALTDLHPVGSCLLEGRREECLAQGGIIPAGTEVKVVAVDGIQIKVVRVE